MGEMQSPLIAGLVLIGAGAFQLSPLKAMCLSKCRTPLGFLMTGWRDGKRGALAMGLEHGAFCLGCCWALMLVMFVVGVMNLVWMAGLGVVMLLEKVAPRGDLLARLSGVALILLGLARIFL
jgi:predicted metal-binding membrane protein